MRQQISAKRGNCKNQTSVLEMRSDQANRCSRNQSLTGTARYTNELEGKNRGFWSIFGKSGKTRVVLPRQMQTKVFFVCLWWIGQGRWKPTETAWIGAIRSTTASKSNTCRENELLITWHCTSLLPHRLLCLYFCVLSASVTSNFVLMYKCG